MTARILPHRIAQAVYQQALTDREVARRIRLYRWKRWLFSREVRIAALTLLMLVGFLYGVVFADTGEPKPVSHSLLIAVLILAGLALLGCSVGILLYLLETDAQEEEGDVLPRQPWR